MANGIPSPGLLLNSILSGDTDRQEENPGPIAPKTPEIFLQRAQLVHRAIKLHNSLLTERRDRKWPAGGRNWQMLEDRQGSIGPAQIHETVFAPALRYLCDDVQASRWIPLADEYAIFGCYAQTELAHGSNVGGLQTLAVFDASRDQFRFHTPVVAATKWWVGALGCCATHAIVWARLLVPYAATADDKVRGKESHGEKQATARSRPRGSRILDRDSDSLRPVLASSLLDARRPAPIQPAIAPTEGSPPRGPTAHSLVSELLESVAENDAQISDSRTGTVTGQARPYAMSAPGNAPGEQRIEEAPPCSIPALLYPALPAKATPMSLGAPMAGAANLSQGPQHSTQSTGVRIPLSARDGSRAFPVELGVRRTIENQLASPGGRWLDLGPHPFIVQIRSTTSLDLLPGVIAGDIGPKLGMEAVDNGFMVLQGLKAPRDALLGGAGAVNKQGKYTPPAQRRRAFAGMLAARTQIVGRSAPALSVAAAIALRYSAHRKQFGPPVKQVTSHAAGGTGLGKEVAPVEWPVLMYPSQHRRVMGAVYAAISLRLLSPAVSQHVDRVGRAPSASLRPVHLLLSVLKPCVTEETASLIETCRRCCGGHGYSKMGGIAGLWATYVHVTTAEGDNYVLAQQAAKSMLSIGMQEQSESDQDCSTPSDPDAVGLAAWTRVLLRDFAGVNPDSCKLPISKTRTVHTEADAGSKRASDDFLAAHASYLGGTIGDEVGVGAHRAARVRDQVVWMSSCVQGLLREMMSECPSGEALYRDSVLSLAYMLEWLGWTCRQHLMRIHSIIGSEVSISKLTMHGAFVAAQEAMMPCVAAHGAVIEVATCIRGLHAARAAAIRMASQALKVTQSVAAGSSPAVKSEPGNVSSTSNLVTSSVTGLLAIAAVGRALALCIDHCKPLLSVPPKDANLPWTGHLHGIERLLTQVCAGGAAHWYAYDQALGVDTHTAGTPLYGRTPGYDAMLKWSSMAPLNRGVGTTPIRIELAKMLAEGRKAVRSRQAALRAKL